ncbi:uncharacterized protein LOC131630357 [Vicia villosa]|uniref:uncharacterized protein LOC131630352 n=1 Tax=Vicia villosa TaxID=3911 RepID=UPI00273BAF85|nr:uncharacterized protein LOC131630352 [Vicia villosa]XP_058757128.1 uncharacterized protein LOC131630357 [Vicia villosa]
MAVFDDFSRATGLRAHPAKCKIYFGGVHHMVKNDILQATGFREGDIPFRYLGVPLSSRKLTIQQCYPLIEKITARIHHWSARLLSYAGRCQLIKSVLFSISAFWMQVLPLSQKIIQHVEALCRSYLWSGKEGLSRKSLVSWENLCKPKSAGGLYITDLQTWNKATLRKLPWNIHLKLDRLWIRWLDTFYFKGEDVLAWQSTPNSSWILKKIVKHKTEVSSTKHWTEAINSGRYKTGAVYKELCGNMEHVSWKHILIDNHARPRACFTLWMALLKRLPTKKRLVRFGIVVNLKCCFCDEEEDIQHLLFGCTYTKAIWQQVLNNLHIQHGPLEWYQEVEWMSKESKPKGAQRLILKLAFAETVYEIWHERNMRIFNDINSGMRLVDRITENITTRCNMYRKLSIHVSM